MKKLLLICVFTLCYSYQAKAQTKEETISWLQEKLQKYVVFNPNFCRSETTSVEVTECSITVRFTLFYPPIDVEQKIYRDQYYIIPTNGLSFFNSTSPQGNGIGMKDGINNIKKKLYNKSEDVDSGTALTVLKGEENLYERLQKAVDHLATFCPKKEEAF